MNRSFVISLLVVVAAVGSIFYFSGPSEQDQANQAAKTPDIAVGESSHTKGVGTTGVVFHEFGDFQCPGCASYYPAVKEIKEQFGEQITFQFHHFPLDTIHPNARRAHRAAEAAGLQGKFFEYHDLLFEQRETWINARDPGPQLESFAAQLGLEIERFKADAASGEVNDIINADIKLGQSKGVDSTPTFAINGAVIDEPNITQARLIELIQQAIDASPQQPEQVEAQPAE